MQLPLATLPISPTNDSPRQPVRSETSRSNAPGSESSVADNRERNSEPTSARTAPVETNVERAQTVRVESPEQASEARQERVASSGNPQADQYQQTARETQTYATDASNGQSGVDVYV